MDSVPFLDATGIEQEGELEVGMAVLLLPDVLDTLDARVR
jgi:hypothetical protein